MTKRIGIIVDGQHAGRGIASLVIKAIARKSETIQSDDANIVGAAVSMEATRRLEDPDLSPFIGRESKDRDCKQRERRRPRQR